MKLPDLNNNDLYTVLVILILSLSFGTGGCQRRPATQDQGYNTQTYDLDRKMAPLENLNNEEASDAPMPADNSMGNITIKF